jgi:hypothetical protein
MNQAGTVFRKPNFFEQILNKGFGFLVGLGIGLRHNYLLQVPGRKTGRVYSTPIDLLEFKGIRFLVAGRGSRNCWLIFRRSPFRGRLPPNAIISARADRSAPSLRHSSHYPDP